MGKPEYAAPELVLGDIQHQDQTTDIYAMGILLYQCIVGHTPFDGARHEILEHQLKDKLPGMSEEEMLALLATDGMLVKRPLLITDDAVLVGFREAEWQAALR